MTDRMATGAARLAARLKSRSSTTMTYRRGDDSVPLSVTIGRAKVGPLTILAGVVADRDLSQPSPEHADHRFWFTSADLIINGSVTTPQEGDTIEQTVSGVTTLYKLCGAHDGTAFWAYDNDDFRTRIVVNGRLKSVT